MYCAFYPGKEWLDTKGEPIQAHGGMILNQNGVYYWIGENKELTDGINGIWTYGVRCYRSKDLYNWEDCGLIIKPDLEDIASPLNPYMVYLDRPHIIYNEMTNKYICWLKIMHKNGIQSLTVLTADDILGPYKIVKTGLRPSNMSTGDFDLVVDKDKKAYCYFEKVHSEIVCIELNDEYTDVTEVYSSHFRHQSPPDVREGIAHFDRNNRFYLVSSGTTGYLPNPSQLSVSNNRHGPFRVLGDPHLDDDSHTSFHSQISCVFKVEGKKDLFIAMADRWLPDRTDLKYEDYEDCFRIHFSKDPSLEQLDYLRQKAKTIPFSTHIDTSKATYIWLPFEFDENRGYLKWRDRWSLDEFDSLDT